MKIFLVGEGPTDCGRKQYDKKKCEYTWLDGPIQIYIHKKYPDAEILAMDKPTFFEEAKKRKNKRNRRALEGLSGHGVNASIIAGMAMEQGFDVAAMYVDADKENGSPAKTEIECRRWYAQVSGNVKKGLQQGGAKQSLAIVPMKMIECWLMGDPDAFREAFGKSVDLALPKEPELLWGDKHDPDSDYPKNRLKKVMERCGVTSCEESFNLIAEHSKLDSLSKNCPISFGDFMTQLREVT